MTIRELFTDFAKMSQIPIQEFHTNPDFPPHLKILMEGEEHSFEGYGLCFEEDQYFVFYTFLGIQIPEEKRQEAALLLMHLNYELKIGGFQMEPVTGQITARVSQYLTGDDLERKALLERIIRTSGLIANQYYGELIK